MSYEVNYKEYCEGKSLESLLRIKNDVTALIEKRKAKLKKPIHFKTRKPLAEATKVFYESDMNGCQKYLEAIEKVISEREAL
jgi:hypothetical protein